MQSGSESDTYILPSISKNGWFSSRWVESLTAILARPDRNISRVLSDASCLEGSNMKPTYRWSAEIRKRNAMFDTNMTCTLTPANDLVSVTSVLARALLPVSNSGLLVQVFLTFGSIPSHP